MVVKIEIEEKKKEEEQDNEQDTEVKEVQTKMEDMGKEEKGEDGFLGGEWGGRKGVIDVFRPSTP